MRVRVDPDWLHVNGIDFFHFICNAELEVLEYRNGQPWVFRLDPLPGITFFNYWIIPAGSLESGQYYRLRDCWNRFNKIDSLGWEALLIEG